jgi:hypothetical protein
MIRDNEIVKEAGSGERAIVQLVNCATWNYCRMIFNVEEKTRTVAVCGCGVGRIFCCCK